MFVVVIELVEYGDWLLCSRQKNFGTVPESLPDFTLLFKFKFEFELLPALVFVKFL